MTAHLQGKTQARYPNPNTTENHTIQPWPPAITTGVPALISEEFIRGKRKDRFFCRNCSIKRFAL